MINRLTGRLLTVRPFAAVDGAGTEAADALSCWCLPETHQDVRGGETVAFAAQRVMVTAFGLKIDPVGIMLVLSSFVCG